MTKSSDHVHRFPSVSAGDEEGEIWEGAFGGDSQVDGDPGQETDPPQTLFGTQTGFKSGQH